MKLNREKLEDIKKSMRVYKDIKFLEDLLKHYGLIEKDSTNFENKLLSFSHLDLEIGGKYEQSVTVWMDFITTVCVMFGAEPLVLTENGGVPNLRHLLKVIQGLDICDCPKCKGKGQVINPVDYLFYPCEDCHSLGFMLPEVSLRFE